MLWRIAIILFLGVCNLALFARMVWSPTGLVHYNALKDQYKSLQEDVARLDENNIQLSREIRLLQTDPEYVEKMVRQKLHYLRDNEIVYIFATNPENDRGAKRDDGKN